MLIPPYDGDPKKAYVFNGENFTSGGGGALEPPQIWGARGGGRGVAERGSKGHKLISSIPMSEILPPTIPGGGGAVHVHKAHTHPIPIARNAGTC